MNYTVNLGCWGSIFAVPTDVVDKYLKIAGSAQLKVLLYILRSSGSAFDASDIAQALGMDAFDVKDCIEFWSSFGIIRENGGEITPAESPAPSPAKCPAPAPAPVLKSAPAAAPDKQTGGYPEQKSEEPPRPERPSDTVMARPLRPDPIYVAKRVSEDKEIEALLNEAQYIFGRPVSPNENAGLIMLHDNDGLPCEVILMLLTYGASNQKGMRQIEAMGAAWAKEGILTLEQADEKIRRLEESKEAYHRIQSVLGLEFRKPSRKEEELYTQWLGEWKFGDDMIKEAYDICVNAKGKYIPNYVNTILRSWHEAGISTPEQARAQRSRGAEQKNSGERNSSFDINDLSGLGMFND